MRIGSLSARTKAIIIQVVVFAGLIAYFKVALPRIEKARAEEAAAKREQRIESFVQSVVVEAAVRENDAPATNEEQNPRSQLFPRLLGQWQRAPASNGATRARPQRLRITPAVDEVRETLGAPEQNMTDFRGGQHLTWTGKSHRLDLSFNKGRLYALALTDLQTGKGMTVFESSAQWQQF